MRLIPQFAYDHVQGTLAVQNGGQTLYNWLEAGIGVFGDRNVNPFYTPHFWAYYQPQGGTGTFYDLGEVLALENSHIIELRETPTDSGKWQVVINGTDRLPKTVPLNNLEWLTIFSEDHNQTNPDCSPHHVTYAAASRQMNNSPSADPPYDDLASSPLCHHWNAYYNWEIYWQSDLPIYCQGQGPFRPFAEAPLMAAPPGFPTVPPD